MRIYRRINVRYRIYVRIIMRIYRRINVRYRIYVRINDENI